MDKVLFINACIRPESRTLRMARHLLEMLSGTVQEVTLEREKIPALNAETLKYRQELLAAERFDDPMLKYACQFREADIIVIAAPYYDLSFSSCLKNYLEAICCVGLTFYYDAQENPQTLCRAKKLYYVSTGGGELKKEYGFRYVKAVVQEFFHIPDVVGFFAEKLDLLGSDADVIMENTLSDIDLHFSATCYHKLVRDKIPQIIAAQGETPIVRILDEEAWRDQLLEKLDEEVEEFHRDRNLEELADILEVTYALAESLGYTKEELHGLCDAKREKRGAFHNRMFLIAKE